MVGFGSGVAGKTVHRGATRGGCVFRLLVLVQSGAFGVAGQAAGEQAVPWMLRNRQVKHKLGFAEVGGRRNEAALPSRRALRRRPGDPIDARTVSEFVERVWEREGVSDAPHERANVLVHIGLLAGVLFAFGPRPIGRIVADAIGR